MTSPARAGSTLLAANPTAVARKALANEVDHQRLEQTLPPPRTNRQVGEHRGERQHQPLGTRMDDLPHDAADIDVAEKERDQNDGERDDGEGAQVRPHD